MIEGRKKSAANRFQHFSNHKCLLLSACSGVLFIMSILCGIHSLNIIHFPFYPFHSISNAPVIVIVFTFFLSLYLFLSISLSFFVRLPCSLFFVFSSHILFGKLITVDNVIHRLSEWIIFEIIFYRRFPFHSIDKNCNYCHQTG